ncbi:MAG: hypothetical protein JWO36_2210 [Myxococcales bacterium]|nr:hypothetical protein [Myxococcales bacterium]
MIFVGIALAVMGVMVYTMVRFKMHQNDPGGEACDRVVELTKAPADGDAWDKKVDETAKLIADSYVKRKAPSDEPVAVTGSTRDDRCRVLFLRLTNVTTYPVFDKLVKCIAQAQLASEQRACIDAAVID